MAPIVTLATSCLRDGLLDVLTDFAGGLHAALLPSTEGSDVHSAQLRYVKAKAIGDLLDAVGWAPDELTPLYRLDIAVHGWAATTALKRVVSRESLSTWQHAAFEDPEASGSAGARRLAAEHELSLIQQTCEQAKISIAPPHT